MIRFKTIKKPATSLSSEEQSSLLSEILSLNLSLSDNECFRNNWLQRSNSFMAGTDLLDLVYKKGKLIGHYSSRQIATGGLNLTYIDTFTVHPDFQASSIGSIISVRMLLHGLLRTRGQGFMIGSRTQAPYLAAVIWAGFGLKNYFPCFKPDAGSTPELVSVATSMAGKLWPDCEFCPETGVLKAAYGGSFLPSVPTRRSVVQKHFDRYVNHERGDAIVQVVWFRLSTLISLIRYYSDVGLRVLSSGRIRWYS